MAKELDEPLELELRTQREVAVVMAALGNQIPMFQMGGEMTKAIATANLQHRMAAEDEITVAESIDAHGFALSPGEGEMSTKALVSMLATEDEVDPENPDGEDVGWVD